ncbi:ArnT family glycosyltransferase [Pontibacter chitinilyticus]|uniref:ArnT family glycosyltransferase n=1 Tax=Pontibacter chitinilyticus TaxID=2674989 RepID=UPI00321C3AF6
MENTSAIQVLKSAKGVIALLALCNVVLHLLFYNNLEFHRDELLYFSFGRHPAFGYASAPPLIAWLATGLQFLFGYSLLAVRILPAILSGVLIILTSAIARVLGGKGYAQILAAIALIFTPLSLRAYFLYQPVALDVLFWTLLLYLLTRYLQTSEEKYLLYFGIVLGFALLNKYLVGLLVLGLVLLLAVTKHRKVFTRKKFYWGIAAAMLIFLPNLLWQLAMGLPVFHHMQELNNTQLVHVNPAVFLTGQLEIAMGASLLTLPGMLFLLLHPRMQRYRLLGYLTVFVVVALLLLHGKSYYTMGIFPMLIAAGAVCYENLLQRIVFRVALPILVAMLMLPLLPFGLPVLKPKGLVRYFNTLETKYKLDLGRRFEDGTVHSLPQDYADMLGWEELASLTNKAYQQVPDKQRCVIYCENYGQAGAIYIIGNKYGLPQPVSFNESFRYWSPREFKPEVTHLIYINDVLGDDVKQAFGHVQLIGKISNPNAREYGTAVYLCSYPLQNFNVLWKAAWQREEGR